jgi:PAS domain S-box-containing protein
LKGKGDLNIEHRMIRSDGSIITVKDTVEVTTGRGNRPVFILGVVQDISELKRVSEVLRDTENLYRIVFETMAEGVIVKDTQGNIVVCNDEAAKILGAPSKEELMVINNVDWRPVNEDGSVSPSNELPFNFTTAVNDSMNNQIKGVRTCSGEMKWLSITTRPLFLARGGDPIGGVVSFVDITEMKMAEIERQQSENKYRMIAENMADVITVFDMALRITYVSPSIFNQRGYRPEDAMSQSLEEILTPTSWELVQRAFAEEIKKEILRDVVQERTIILELEEYRKDGTTIWVSNAVKFVRDQEGHPTSIIVLARDITEKKLADDALREANRKLSLLSSITRYDILNQLHILSGSLSLMDSKSNGNAKAMNRTISVLSNIESLIRFTGEYDQLGSRAPRFIGIRSEVGRIAEEITLTGIKVVNELGGEEVMADPLLNKVFYNLIENTARHGEKATQIIFRSEEAGGVLRIICEDDGVGVPDEYKHIQFEKGKGKNFGLGLFFVKEILSITGITIHEDGRPGKGARFVITVPKGKWRISSS